MEAAQHGGTSDALYVLIGCFRKSKTGGMDSWSVLVDAERGVRELTKTGQEEIWGWWECSVLWPWCGCGLYKLLHVYKNSLKVHLKRKKRAAGLFPTLWEPGQHFSRWCHEWGGKGCLWKCRSPGFSADPPDQTLRRQGTGTCIFSNLTGAMAGRVGNCCSRHLEKRSRTWHVRPFRLLVKCCRCPDMPGFALGKPTVINLRFMETPLPTHTHPPQPHHHTYAISRGAAPFVTWGSRRRSGQELMTVQESMGRRRVGGCVPWILSPSSAIDMGESLPKMVSIFLKHTWGIRFM